MRLYKWRSGDARCSRKQFAVARADNAVRYLITSVVGREKMKIAKISLLLSLMTATGAEESSVEGELVQSLHSVTTDSALDNTDLVLAFVVGPLIVSIKKG